MISIISLLIVLTLSILITRVATIALSHTGLSAETARFQARSAFTGVGFTTSESEKVVNHPVRRRILITLMLLGNAGIVTAVSSLILTFISKSESSTLTLKIVVLISGIVILWIVAQSQWVDKHLSRIIDKALKQYTRLEIKDYARLLQLAGEYQVSELYVSSEDWIAQKELQELKLRDEGIVVLGIHRNDGTYLGTPKGDTILLPEDTLILYGRTSALQLLDERRKGWIGEFEHQKAMREHEKVIEEEKSMKKEKHSEEDKDKTKMI